MTLPRTGPDTAGVIARPLESLGPLRRVIRRAPGTRLHLLGSLLGEIYSAVVGTVPASAATSQP